MNIAKTSDSPPNPLHVIESAAAQASKTAEKYRFRKAKDGRGRTLEGLWIRNGRYYGKVRIPSKGSRAVPLFDEDRRPVETVREAQVAYRLVLTNKDAGDMPLARRGTPFSTYHEHYTTRLEKMGKKTKLTIDKEKFALRKWAETLGTIPINQITRIEINRHLNMRKDEGCCNRTLNLDVIALGNCLRFAMQEEGLLKHVATDGVKPLDHKAPVRTLIAEEDIETICTEATKRHETGLTVHANGQQLSDYLHFLLFTGARRESALWVQWDHVDFDNRRLTLVKTKYSKVNVVVTFNDRLEKLLLEMKERKLESPWLFPNPLRLTDRANFRKTFDRVRKATELENFNFHDCRHFFISWAIMGGIDPMTVAKWVSHSDGGVLIGKVYGHLNDEHLQAQAKKLTFGRKDDVVESKSEDSVPAASAQAPQMVDLTKMSAAELLAALVNLQKKDPVVA